MTNVNRRALLFAGLVSAALIATSRPSVQDGTRRAPLPVRAAASEALDKRGAFHRPDTTGVEALSDAASGESPVRDVAAESGNLRSGQASEPRKLGQDGNPLEPVTFAAALEIERAGAFLVSATLQPSTFRRSLSEMTGSTFAAGARSNRSDVTNLPNAEVGKYYCARLVDSSDAEAFDLVITSGFVPKGMILNKVSGELCGAPSESGIFRFGIGLRDFSGARREVAYRLVVANMSQAAADDSDLVLETSELAPGTLGAEYVFQLAAAGGSPPYRWTATGLPDGLEVDESTGLLGGSPAEFGELGVQISVTDAAKRIAKRSFSLVIRTTPVFVTTADLGEGTVGELLQVRLGAQGGVPPYRWELIGEAPKGVAFQEASGVLEGVPQEAFQGVLSFRVIDHNEATDTADLPLIVHETELRIVTRSLSDAFVGEAYGALLAVEGGKPPYTWFENGGIPDGLALDTSGRVSGTPVRPGEYTILLGVSDSAEHSATRTAKLRIDVPETDDEKDDEEPKSTPEPTPTPDVSDEGGGEETVPLPAVSDFVAVPSDGKVGLSWKPPLHPGFAGVTIVRAEGAAPGDPSEGTVVVSSSSDTQLLDVGLVNGRTYGYTAFTEYSPDAAGDEPAAQNAFTTPRTPSLEAHPDPFADRVTEFSPLDRSCFNCGSYSTVVLGPPNGAGEFTGSSDVVALGARVNDDAGKSGPYGGTLVLEFSDNIIVDGPGIDFVIFENAFRMLGTDDYFIEPATIEVSADGVHFYRFAVDFVPHYRADGSLNLWNPFSYPQGFAGVRPVYSQGGKPSPLNPALAGGDTFDLADLPGAPLRWARFVRIVSTGDSAMTDRDGDVVRHSNSAPTWGASGKGNSGFDLDAAAAVNY